MTTSSSDRSSQVGEQSAGRVTRDELLLLLSLTVVAGLLRFWGLGSQALWYDEAWTRDLARFGFFDMLNQIPKTESTPPLYYLFNWVTWRVFGPSEWTLRLIAAVAGTLTVPAVWLAGRQLVSRNAALIAAAFCTFSPMMWWYSQEARAYSLVALLFALALACFGEALRRPGWLALLGWGIFSAGAVMTQYVAVLPVALTGLILLWRCDGARVRVVAAGLVPTLAGVSLIQLAVRQRGTGNSDWVPYLSFNVRLAQVPAQAWVGNAIARSHVELIVAAILGVLAAGCLALMARRAQAAERSGIVAASLVAGGSLIALIVAALVGWDLLIARNLLVAWPAAVVAAGGCLAVLKPRMAVTVTAIACALMLGLIIRVQVDPALQRVDWRPVPGLLGAVPEGGRVVALQPFGNKRPLSVYAKGIDYIPAGGVKVRELEVVSAQLPQPRICWWGGVCSDGIRVDYNSQPVDLNEIAGLKRVAVRRDGTFTVVEYRSSTPKLLTSDRVRAALPRNLRGGVLFQPN